MLFLDQTLPGCASSIDFRLAADLRSLHHPGQMQSSPLGSRPGTISVDLEWTARGIHVAQWQRHRLICPRHLIPLDNNLGTNLLARE